MHASRFETPAPHENHSEVPTTRNRRDLLQIVKQVISIVLNLCLGLFLAAGVVSLLDDTLVLFFGYHLLTAISAIVSFFAFLAAVLVYGLMGLTPMIPKRVFLPVTLFWAVGLMATIPALIYCHGRILQVDWAISFAQVVFGVGILCWLQGSLKFRWPIVEAKHLGDRRFSWVNLLVFPLITFFVLLPALVFYLFFCVTLAADHFSGGFLAVHPGGMTVQVRRYVRDDGKTIQLIPMAHVAEAEFYRKVSRSFPTNSIILMEGVTDNRHLITNKVSYKRMARALHLAEQHEEFEPTRGVLVQADVDTSLFSTNTIDLLNLVMLVHSKGVNPATVEKMLQYSPPPDILEQLTGDILRARDRHLSDEIQAWLPQSENIIVPWGVAHMPEIAEEIQKSGFRLHETREYEVIRFYSSRAAK